MDVVVTDAADRARFEAHVDGRLAGFAQYVRLGDKLLFTHVEVGDEFEGAGVASAITRHALDAARVAGRVVRPLCPFVADWIRRHPDYLDLVDPVDHDKVTHPAR
ncbi:hypothetical protein LX15_004606 [Streptoalloteichus tenebrarius]|uniref:N-acetyltransferase domain-containing protein n=1 Tax=Streptoalloteichus tenebrarius (strain ATCC 17920 / DSM 40477 / JCM 4838 / CBS 697.72 / NBRC 16177 / NCIMB 11028 / NRRL B-12390 / A12253. 1 / ISP 5477) TaxID=1933 RepID=A0ABT1HZC6_STRSD|nr:GNAT family N-acetyltransferase [Streptoalloteichus tenebrarius]MCP2260886.1 hypothetical protein [Streptoalloteichus tenebrarius]BFF03354.1 GNAT family N-acetyltransferase [Streptoalloteichus tenebrarius]